MQNAAWKVGLLVIVFAAMAYGVYIFWGSQFSKQNMYRLYADFNNIGGLTRGAKVMLAGVEVGSVNTVSLVSPTLARATLDIKREFKIPLGSVATLPGSVFLPADQKIDIVPPKVVAGSFEPGMTMHGTIGKSLDSILPEGEKTLVAIQETLKSVRNLLDDKQAKGRINGILANAEIASAQIKILALRLTKFAGDNEHILTGALKNMSQATEDVRKAVAAATELVTDPQWRSRAEVLLDALQNTMDRANEVVASVHELVGDPELKKNIEATVANAAQITQAGTEVASTGKEIAANVKTFSEKANVLADDAQEIATEAKELFSRLNALLGAGGLKGPRFNRPVVTLDFMRNTDKDLFRTDIVATYPLSSDSFVNGGVYDATESNKLILQYGLKSTPNLLTRYGLYAAKPGVGVDFSLSPKVTLQADLFDPNDATLNVRSRFNFGRNWGAFVGFDRLFRDNSFVVGLSLNR